MKKHFLITEEVPEFFISDLTKAGFEVIYKPNISLSELRQIIPDFYAILIRSRIILDKEMLDLAKNLSMIFRPGSGLDIIDTETAENKNIIIFNSPEGNRDAVGEHALGLLLSLINHIPASFDEIKNGRWNRRKNIGTEIKGKKIGIIGFGNTGSAFAKKISSFDPEILAYDKYKTSYAFPAVRETDMEVIFSEAEIVSFHIPLTSETKYLVNREYLKKFSKQVYLINTSRGKIINSEDLLWAIQNDIVLGAALDVLENENFKTYSATERALINALISTGRVLITPHIAGLTVESEKRIFSVLIDKLLIFNDLKII